MDRPRIATSPDDVAAALDVQHLAFGGGRPRLAFHALRLASARRARARLWVLEEEGRVASALLAYPLVFGTPAGARAGGVGLGAVTTHPELRGRGHASRLCAHVLAEGEREGRPLGLLFSAIPPGIYERLGFRALPAWAHRTERLAELAACGPVEAWAPIAPARTAERLAELYDAAHAGTLHLARDAEVWERTWRESPTHAWLGLGDPAWPDAYARVEWVEDRLHVEELVLPPGGARGGDGGEACALRGLASFALELGLRRMGHWLAPSRELGAWFEDGGREHSLPMVRGADAETGGPGARALLWASDYF